MATGRREGSGDFIHLNAHTNATVRAWGGGGYEGPSPDQMAHIGPFLATYTKSRRWGDSTPHVRQFSGTNQGV